ncbi:hypothetical protein [Streptomyces sp. Ag109_O5-10]|uniref:hypothetical protein n=2 Tax=unclassified Streptomyces TaxID=2593676 RepID=UPI00089900A2|nr:hypothetical protein [Streptomyces sp. Ag109_O5-10]SEE87344.1 hypothetical protein SAMN05216533_4098 [Streptomyces sp. Ag109_O5-10]
MRPAGAGQRPILTSRPAGHSDEERQRDVAARLDDVVRAERAKHHKNESAHHKEKPTGT